MYKLALVGGLLFLFSFETEAKCPNTIDQFYTQNQGPTDQNEALMIEEVGAILEDHDFEVIESNILLHDKNSGRPVAELDILARDPQGQLVIFELKNSCPFGKHPKERAKRTKLKRLASHLQKSPFEEPVGRVFVVSRFSGDPKASRPWREKGLEYSPLDELPTYLIQN